MEDSWPSGSCPEYPHIRVPFASEPISKLSWKQITTTNLEQSVDIHQLHRFHTHNFPHSARASWRQLHVTSWSLSPIASTRQFCSNKRINLASPDIEPGIQRWGSNILTTMLPFTPEIQVLQFIYSHYQSPRLTFHPFLFPVPAQDIFFSALPFPTYQPLAIYIQSGSSYPDSHTATYQTWLVRCSSHTPGFSREQFAWY